MTYFPECSANNFAMCASGSPKAIGSWDIFPMDDPVAIGTKIDGMVFGNNGPSLAGLGFQEFSGMIFRKNDPNIDRLALQVAYRVCSNGSISFSKRGEVIFASEKTTELMAEMGARRNLNPVPKNKLVDLKEIFNFSRKEIKSMGSLVEAIYQSVMNMETQDRALLVADLEFYHVGLSLLRNGVDGTVGPYASKLETYWDDYGIPRVRFIRKKPSRVGLIGLDLYGVLQLVRMLNAHASRSKFHLMWYYKPHFPGLVKEVVELIRNIARFNDKLGADVTGFPHVASLVASYPKDIPGCNIRSNAAIQARKVNVKVLPITSDSDYKTAIFNLTINSAANRGARKTSLERAKEALDAVISTISRLEKSWKRVFVRISIEFIELMTIETFVKSGFGVVLDIDPLSGFFGLPMMLVLMIVLGMLARL